MFFSTFSNLHNNKIKEWNKNKSKILICWHHCRCVPDSYSAETRSNGCYRLKRCSHTYPQIFLPKWNVLSRKTMRVCKVTWARNNVWMYDSHAPTLYHRIKCLVCENHILFAVPEYIKNKINVPKLYLMWAIHLTVKNSNLLLYLAEFKT